MSCPMCGKQTHPEARPFCSKRCADLDLAKWLNGSYAVASNDPEDMDHLEDALAKAQRDGSSDKPH
ncbi:MAG: DNA gyrase inhibitor YacG [Roseobacter sp.]